MHFITVQRFYAVTCKPYTKINADGRGLVCHKPNSKDGIIILQVSWKTQLSASWYNQQYSNEQNDRKRWTCQLKPASDYSSCRWMTWIFCQRPQRSPAFQLHSITSILTTTAHSNPYTYLQQRHDGWSIGLLDFKGENKFGIARRRTHLLQVAAMLTCFDTPHRPLAFSFPVFASANSRLSPQGMFPARPAAIALHVTTPILARA